MNDNFINRCGCEYSVDVDYDWVDERITVNEVWLMKDCGQHNADLARITAERDAAISDLQDAVDYVYNVYGESNETLAAITTAHWRAVISDVKKKSL